MSNRLTLHEFDTMAIGDIAKLPADQLAMLDEDLDSEAARVKRQRAWLDSAFALRYADRERQLRSAEAKPFGAVAIDDGDYLVSVDVPKKPQWNQAKLREAVAKIQAMGEDPAEYVSAELKISETRFNAWPQAVRAIFEPARTVSAGKISYDFNLKGGR